MDKQMDKYSLHKIITIGERWWVNIVFLILILFIGRGYSELYWRLDIFPRVMNSTGFFIFTWEHFTALSINILMGMLFGVETFWRRVKASGRWQLDIARLLIIGMPLIFLTVDFFLFSVNQTMLTILVQTAPAREPFYRFVLGYVLITSFVKTDYSTCRNP